MVKFMKKSIIAAALLAVMGEKRNLRWGIVFWLMISGLQAHAAESYFNFTFEDDLFAGRDYGYTGGSQLDWSKGLAHSYDELTPSWIAAAAKPLWLNSESDKLKGVSYKVGEMVNTPQDMSRKDPDPTDLPYSGMLYWQATLHALDDNTADRVLLLLGMVGPLSGAEYVQKGIHHVTGSQQPKGWGSQLDNEPVFQAGAARRWRAAYYNFEDSRWGVDVVTNSEIGIGTFESTADQYVSFRLGQDLLRSYPTAGLLPGRDINPLAGVPGRNFNIFVTVMARYQPNAIYVQGNTFGGRRTDLKLEREQQAWSGGLDWSTGLWGYEIAMVRNTRIFDGQHAFQTFGQISVTRRY
jgi:hypothetical protein